jgi:hypothetical protein
MITNDPRRRTSADAPALRPWPGVPLGAARRDDAQEPVQARQHGDLPAQLSPFRHGQLVGPGDRWPATRPAPETATAKRRHPAESNTPGRHRDRRPDRPARDQHDQCRVSMATVTTAQTRTDHPVTRGHEHRKPRVMIRPERKRISHAGNIPSVTTRDRHSRHRAVRDAETVQVAVTADQDAARAEKVTAVLIKRCRTVLTERCCYITK